MCHFFILEKALFSGLKLTSVYSRRRFKSFKCSTFLKIEAFLEKKASGTSAVTAVIYSGNAQSLSGLTRDLLASGTLYQSCHLRCSCVGFFIDILPTVV